MGMIRMVGLLVKILYHSSNIKYPTKLKGLRIVILEWDTDLLFSFRHVTSPFLCTSVKGGTLCLLIKYQ